MYLIQSETFQARVRPLGAELCSLIHKPSGQEYMFTGDAKIWSGSAPILFPFVGRLKGGQYSHQGVDYKMPIHGFAASSEFALHSQSDSAITLVLKDSPATRLSYPFAFTLSVTFSISNDGLKVDYVVSNNSEETLYFALGSHPAFTLNSEDMQSANAHVSFNKPMPAKCYKLDGDLLSAHAVDAPLVHNELLLGADTFADDALIFKHIDADEISLHCKGEKRLTMHTQGLPHLGLWAKPNAPYVCIEPWLATDENINSPKELCEKEDLVALSPQKQYQTGYHVVIHDH